MKLATSEDMDSIRYNAVSREIYKAIINDDWDSVSHIFKADKERLNSSISSYGETPLFMAVGTNNSHHFVEKLVEQIMTIGGGVQMLRTQCGIKSYNSLHMAAKRGNSRDVKLLVCMDPDMPQTVAIDRMTTPLTLAAWSGDEETIHFLLSVTRNEVLTGGDATTSPFRGISGATTLKHIITAGLYDVALYLVRKYPHLVAQKTYTGETAVEILAAQDDAFPSGSRLGFFGRSIYSRISVNPEKTLDYVPTRRQDHSVIVDIENGRRSGSTNNLNFLWSCFDKVPYIKHIRDIRVRHVHAQELLKQILSVLLNLEDNICRKVLAHGMHTAVCHGHHELIEECIINHPQLVWYREAAGVVPQLFRAAIEHRQVKVFNLMYQISARKADALAMIDGENGLHLVGKLAPYERLRTVTGVALQMQRELLWFKEVEKFIEPGQREQLNREKKTPKMVFTDEHKQLLIDAQQWTKDTSSSSTLVAALIVTMTFAAMFTAPGGNSDNGKSIFLKDAVFHLFVISVAIAIFSSSTSVLMFLSTLTHSSQEDFLYALPLRLTLGLISLFISLAATMVAFSATLVLVLCDKMQWIVAPVTLLACIPVVLFLWLQYPLLHELVGATFGKSIFHRQSKVWLH